MNLIKRLALPACLVAMLLLAACSTATPTPVAPLPTQLPPLFTDVMEMQFVQPAAALPDGPFTGLTGIYAADETGQPTLTLCQLEKAALACAGYPVTLADAPAGLVRVSGQAAGGSLTISQAEPVTWDEPAAQAAAQAKLAEIAGELASYDWSTIADPEFGESSAWFHPDSQRLLTIPLELYAFDNTADLIILRGQGWEMPKQTRTVYRFPVLYLAVDPTGQLPTRAFVSIEGYTEQES